MLIGQSFHLDTNPSPILYGIAEIVKTNCTKVGKKSGIFRHNAINAVQWVVAGGDVRKYPPAGKPASSAPVARGIPDAPTDNPASSAPVARGIPDAPIGKPVPHLEIRLDGCVCHKVW